MSDDEGESPLASTNGSFLDQLKARRRALGESRTVDFEVPGYGGDLVVRYKLLSWDEVQAIRRKFAGSKDPRRELLGATDVLIAACEQVLVRGSKDKQAESETGLVAFNVVFGTGDDPVRFDTVLAEQLGYEARRTREVVWGLFQNDLAVVQHNNELSEWMTGEGQAVDEEFVGESPAGQRS